MVDNIVDCYYDPEKDEIFLSNIGEYEELSEDEIDELFGERIDVVPYSDDVPSYIINALSLINMNFYPGEI